ncbi:Protein CBR-SRD-56 [Caenorhabditis briggsae]|uniref:Protein CBR-SRD-56 n=1 Tax=Caenorhabditis briggsae TaxID=6238 RepID=A8XH25_CAEBR|nr:Protein CBR-SRD-56 [Caenorhabditis briggsae]CAP31949.2 Protein CBR-SRD-56 [Caenorhabditis briggsae]
MCTSSDCYVPIFNVFWILYGVFGFTFQVILVFLILYKLPVYLRNLKFYLINTACIQLALVLFSFSIQHRLLANKTTLAILPAGPCKYFGPNVCFASYHFAMAFGVAAGLAILITVIFRCLSLTMNGVTRKQSLMLIALSYFVPLYVLVIPFLAPWDFQSVQHATILDHPTYNLTNYFPFPGFSDLKSFEFISATILISIAGYGIPLGCLILTTKGLRLVKKHQNMKINSWTISTIYITSYIVCSDGFQLYLHSSNRSRSFNIRLVLLFISCDYYRLSEHLTLATNALPGLVDPLISFYFIIPFRHTIIETILRNKTSRDVVVIAHTSSIAPI